MLMMLWVNDFAGVSGLPHWLHHAGMKEDMMGFSDLVFPGFLFCVGLSLPLAIENRFSKGDSLLKVFSHIISRSFALIVMGIFSMNCSGIEGGLNGQWFGIIMVVAYFLIWDTYPKAEGWKKNLFTVLRVLGALILIGLLAYRVAMGRPIRTGWWGILGLIGWAYLICALAYLLVRKNFFGNIAVWAVITGFMIAQASGISQLGFYPGGWTHPTLVFSGALITMFMNRFASDKSPLPLAGVLLSCALLMFAAGRLCHNFWICSKIMATPTWAFLSIACFLPVLTILYLICDFKGWTAWAKPIRPAGTATLTCYVLPTIWYGVKQLAEINTPAVLHNGLPGLARSMVFAFVIVAIGGLLSKIHIKLKI